MEFIALGAILAGIYFVYSQHKNALKRSETELANVAIKRQEERIAVKEKEVQNARKRFDKAVKDFESDSDTDSGESGDGNRG